LEKVKFFSKETGMFCFGSVWQKTQLKFTDLVRFIPWELKIISKREIFQAILRIKVCDSEP